MQLISLVHSTFILFNSLPIMGGRRYKRKNREYARQEIHPDIMGLMELALQICDKHEDTAWPDMDSINEIEHLAIIVERTAIRIQQRAKEFKKLNLEQKDRVA